MSHPPTLPIDGPDAFPILQELTFLDHARVAPLSARAADALAGYAHHAAARAWIAGGWQKRIREIRTRIPSLINARSHREIAFMPNTSAGLAQVANGLTWHAGDEVVITNVEYPANRYPWINLAQRHGVKVVEVHQQPDGRIELEDVIEAVTDRTRVVSLSHVQFASGHRIDLAPIAHTVHQVGGYLCVDAIQSVGALPVDVQRDGVDFLAADGHKWMLGPEGAGLIYVRRDRLDLLGPEMTGWLGRVRSWDYTDHDQPLVTGAARFEEGTWNVAGLAAMGESIGLLLEVGAEQAWRRIEQLTGRIEDGARRLGFQVVSPRADGERSGIIALTRPGLDADAWRRALEERSIIVAARRGWLRASPHFYNEPAQADRLVEALAEIAR